MLNHPIASPWRLRFAPALVLGLLALPLASPALAATDALGGLSRLRDAETQRSSSADPDWRDNNADWKPIPAGQTRVIADLEGPGVITHIWNTVSAQEPGYSRLLRLRMYWDGETDPSVDVPLGDFFAAGHGMDVPVDSQPVRVTSNGRARNCYWPMPFRRSARITLTNEGQRDLSVYWYVDWQKLKTLPADEAYFHAQYRQEYPAVMNQNYLVADIRGRGHYVGTVLSVYTHRPDWWGEGDDLFFIDGEAEPRLRGTGTEDYFCDAWGFVKQSGMYYGAPLWEGNETDGGHTTVYRWHIPDPVHFRSSLRLELEHKGVTRNPDGSVRSYHEERDDDFSSVAFWYQTEPHKPFPAMPVAYDRLYGGPYTMIEGESLLDGATATAGPIERQDIGGYSDNAILHWKPTSENQSLTVPFEVAEAGVYSIRLAMVSSWDYGDQQILLDDQPIGGTRPLFSATTVGKTIGISRRPLTAGRHTLTFVNKGKAQDSVGYFFGLDALTLVKAR